VLVLGARGVEVGFCPFGADAQGVAGLFQRGDAGVVGVVTGGADIAVCALAARDVMGRLPPQPSTT
jgi:hypothetical protein